MTIIASEWCVCNETDCRGKFQVDYPPGWTIETSCPYCHSTNTKRSEKENMSPTDD